VADERLTLRQAAARLGVSESAIRKRVERGSLRSDKGPDGRRYVYLDPGASASFAVADTVDAFGSKYLDETEDTLPLYLFESLEMRLGFAHGLFIPPYPAARHLEEPG